MPRPHARPSAPKAPAPAPSTLSEPSRRAVFYFASNYLHAPSTAVKKAIQKVKSAYIDPSNCTVGLHIRWGAPEDSFHYVDHDDSEGALRAFVDCARQVSFYPACFQRAFEIRAKSGQAADADARTIAGRGARQDTGWHGCLPRTRSG